MCLVSDPQTQRCIMKNDPRPFLGRALLGAAALTVAAGLLPATAGASQHLLPQVKRMAGCLVMRAPHGGYIPRLTVCGANYTDVLLAVNAPRERYPIALGMARYSHRPVEACQCKANAILVKAQQVAKYNRRQFRSWWKKPRTPAGHALRGCLKGAASVLGAWLATAFSTGHWDDSQVLWSLAFGCGVGALADA